MSLHLLVGCMFSGKSSEIIRLAKRLQVIGKSVLLITSHLDTRYNPGSICSHDNVSMDSICVSKLQDIQESFLNSYEYIIIDEAQFFPDLYRFVLHNVDYKQKHLTVVGLNGDSHRQPFGEIHKLYPMADKIQLLTALCVHCQDGTPALFSKKITDEDMQIDVGESDKYKPVCRKCYLDASV